jgi:hypothetical protein
VYNDMESHLQKLKLCFQKCREYGISLNLDKYAFMVFLRMILGFIRKGNYHIQRKYKQSQTCHYLKIPNRFKYSRGWHSFIDVLLLFLM